MDDDIFKVERLLKHGASLEDVAYLKRYFRVTLESVASEVIRVCKSGKVAYNLGTIQKIIVGKAARAVTNEAHLPQDVVFFHQVNSDATFLRLVARTVKNGIDDGSLRPSGGSMLMLREATSFSDIIDPIHYRLDGARRKFRDVKNAKKLKCEAAKKGSNGAGAAIQKSNAARTAEKAVAEESEGFVARNLKKIGTGIKKAAGWLFRRVAK